MLWELLILIIIAIIFLYRWVVKNNDFFEKRHVPYDKPAFFFGSGKEIYLRKKSIVQVFCEVYSRHDGIVYGTFDNRDPVLMIRDPELIKHITVKDFQHFVNHKKFPIDIGENLWTSSLIIMENDKWRDMRSTLTPAFTGSKMRQMFQLMLQKMEEAMSYLKEEQQKVNRNNTEGIEVDAKDFTTRLTNDIIASTAFGLEVNSFHDKDNEFYIKAIQALNFSVLQQMKLLFMIMVPKLVEYFKIEVFDKAYTDYFMKLVLDAMKYRKENNIHRPDMINLLMEAKGMIPSDTPKAHFHEWSDVEMVAQCFLFFLAGFEPSSTVMSFAAYELMENPDVQNRLFKEINETEEILEGKPISYEVLQKMRYMDMVVSEVLRKWPVTLVTDRQCNKDYEYVSELTGERITIKAGDVIRIPMISIQRDPKYYENPEVFDPERFNEENKTKIHFGTYLPFGLGPRSCIGNRFALLEIKAFLYYLLRDFRLEASSKSCIPLVLDIKNVKLQPKNGFWIQFKPRNALEYGFPNICKGNILRLSFSSQKKPETWIEVGTKIYNNKASIIPTRGSAENGPNTKDPHSCNIAKKAGLIKGDFLDIILLATQVKQLTHVSCFVSLLLVYNSTINHLKNEQACKLFNFIIKTSLAGRLTAPTCGGLFYRWATKNNDFFKKRNIPYDEPCFLLGSGKDIVLRRKNIFQGTRDVYHKHNGIVYGVFDNRDPVLLIREPELIKHILIKDFDHFVNRRTMEVGSPENLVSNTLFMMENDRWRDMRSTLSPAFTGSKMRQMFQLILQTVDEAIQYLREHKENVSVEGFELDVRDYTTRLTNDIIASTAFGLKVNSFRDKENEFYIKARKAINFSALQQLKILFIMTMPKLARLLNIEFFDKAYTDYFMHLVLDAMKYRQENQIYRPDMINLLMEARGMITHEVAHKSHFRQWSDIETVAQCFIFFAAGFDTSSTVMNFAAHELMENPAVQEKLYQEIDEVDKELQGNSVTYEILNKMTYMDMVVSEVLRKWPVALAADRTCNKDYEYISEETGEHIEIKKGDYIRFSMAGLHWDPKYYENPEKFDPERFSLDQKSNIDSATYLPFGLGPRNCIVLTSVAPEDTNHETDDDDEHREDNALEFDDFGNIFLNNMKEQAIFITNLISALGPEFSYTYDTTLPISSTTTVVMIGRCHAQSQSCIANDYYQINSTKLGKFHDSRSATMAARAIFNSGSGTAHFSKRCVAYRFNTVFTALLIINYHTTPLPLPHPPKEASFMSRVGKCPSHVCSGIPIVPLFSAPTLPRDLSYPNIRITFTSHKMWLEFMLLFGILGALFYRWATKYYDFFKKRNIPHDKPIFLLGSNKDLTLRKKSVFQVLCEIYQRHDCIAYGTFENRDPVLMIRDPEMIKHILIKDFEYFVNRRQISFPDNDNLLANSIFSMENDKWRDMRNTLSPAFTGSKMRQMFQLMLETVDVAISYLREERQRVATIESDGFEVDIKDFTTRLSNDIIASTAFGLQVNSFRDKNNEFYTKAKQTINFTAIQQMKMVFIMLMPKVAKYLKIELFDRKFTDYFMRLVLDAMKYRQEKNIHRPDMINLLMEARGMIPTETQKTHYRQWTDVEVVAQCFLFFFAGFEPSSGVMSFAAHELMEYPEVQEKLFQEINKVDEQLQGASVTYEILHKMTYMDMVVSEVVRKWPVTLVTDRTCTKDYDYIVPDSGERIAIKKGEVVRIAMCAIHRDPKYYENPEVLNPERFNAENKSKIISGSYLPFGLGPRNCIGNRFALLEVKAFLYYLLRDYRLEASPKTCLPMEIDPKSIQLLPKNGFWLNFVPR
ncbi:uncharacterized protein LOC142219885 [Haematobia irritans]|uniref:uncharacterized protein LOC142219885 n=1 Tax=Haematobia irritans TaxID=7368 RepID=UPI003F4F88F2